MTSNSKVQGLPNLVEKHAAVLTLLGGILGYARGGTGEDRMHSAKRIYVTVTCYFAWS